MGERWEIISSGSCKSKKKWHNNIQNHVNNHVLFSTREFILLQNMGRQYSPQATFSVLTMFCLIHPFYSFFCKKLKNIKNKHVHQNKRSVSSARLTLRQRSWRRKRYKRLMRTGALHQALRTCLWAPSRSLWCEETTMRGTVEDASDEVLRKTSATRGCGCRRFSTEMWFSMLWIDWKDSCLLVWRQANQLCFGLLTTQHQLL